MFSLPMLMLFSSVTPARSDRYGCTCPFHRSGYRFGCLLTEDPGTTGFTTCERFGVLIRGAAAKRTATSCPFRRTTSQAASRPSSSMMRSNVSGTLTDPMIRNRAPVSEISRTVHDKVTRRSLKAAIPAVENATAMHSAFSTRAVSHELPAKPTAPIRRKVVYLGSAVAAEIDLSSGRATKGVAPVAPERWTRRTPLAAGANSSAFPEPSAEQGDR
jgi:hypothetical protein